MATFKYKIVYYTKDGYERTECEEKIDLTINEILEKYKECTITSLRIVRD